MRHILPDPRRNQDGVGMTPDRDAPAYGLLDGAAAAKLSRRLLLTGGGLLFGFAVLGRSKAWAAAEPEMKALGAYDGSGSDFPGFAPGGYVRIGRDGRIVLIMPSTEMGQGIYTAEAMLIAEELEVGLDQIEVAAAPPQAVYAQPLFKAQLTGGSTSIRGFWVPLRQAGAAARIMLVGAAAEMWKVPPGECTASRAVLTHGPTGRTLSYASLIEGASRQPVPSTVLLKPPHEFMLVGKPLKRVDTPAKVNGSAVFGIDVVVPGMKVGAVEICPVVGGTLRSFDDSAVRGLPGVVEVIRIDDAVVVVGDHYWAAKRGLDALRVEWDFGEHVGLSSASLKAELEQAAATGTPIVGRDEGNADEALRHAARRIDAIYDLPYLAHATLEPINTTVHVRPDGCDIWVGTQIPMTAQKLAARITGLPLEKVIIHNHLVGGGFGRRLAGDTIEQAVAFAKQVPYPLKIVWTREQDIRHDHFRPTYHDRITAGLDEKGLPVAWTHRVTSGTVRQYFDEGGWPEGKLDKDSVEGAADTPYDLPVARVDWIRKNSPIKLNWWRGVGPTHNVFVVESFIDELAHSAGRDPIDYRRALLGKNPRSLAVLNLAAKKADWGGPLPDRTGRGVSLHDSFDTHAALVVEAFVSPTGEITLRRIVAAIDCGIQINPDSIRAQIEGGSLFGLSAALHNGITFAGGRVEQSNFHDYRQLRINEVPPIEVHLVPSDAHPGGIGEVGTVSAAPALANAVFAATGRRLRSLPLDRAMKEPQA